MTSDRVHPKDGGAPDDGGRSHPMSVPAGVPPAEVEADEQLVTALLRARCPDLADRPLRRVTGGWDNHLFRLGDDLAVRLPRRRVAVDLILKEQRWLPQLAPSLNLITSVPVRALGPGAGYPWPWSVARWIDGMIADRQPPDPDDAARFGRFLRALHRAPPPDAPRSEVRGVPLVRRNEAVQARLDRISALGAGPALSLDAIRDAWREALAAPVDLPDTWIHGDLHPMNVIVRGGRLAGVIDWGDLCAGDPATDLAAAWFLFDRAEEVFAAYGGISAATFQRARGWAILLGVVFLDTGLHGAAEYEAPGRRLLHRALAGGEPTGSSGVN